MSADGGCGCGGSSAAVAVKGGCGCEQSCGCDVSTTGEGFVRPRFFGGMLLTEDDLQAAVDYAVAKRKLTNRNVIGAGVVCGLEVTCHPCETGKVVVDPGYAIECCGNDLLVSCREEVDILALVRDLRLRKGVDCREPCDDQPRQDYHLYLRYAEVPTAPVAPYAADDCATGECEFSRIREGYRFELRCDPPDRAASVIDALEACRPDGKLLEADTRTMMRVLEIAKGGAAGSGGGTGPPKPPSVADFDKLDQAGSPLAETIELLRRVIAAFVAGTIPDADRTEIAARSRKLARPLPASEELAKLPPEREKPGRRIASIALDLPILPTIPLTPEDAAYLAEPGAPAQDPEREFVAGAERIRARILGDLGRRGETKCDDYRTVSRLRFAALTEAARKDALVLGEAFSRSLAACSCAALHPPCPDCTDDAVALAKVSVDGCDVTDVCMTGRRWVLAPRTLGYWLPVVELLRPFLEQACCAPDVTGPVREPREVVEAWLGAARTAGERAVEGLAGAPPELRKLLVAMADPDAAAEQPVATNLASGAPSTLEVRLEELADRVDKLAAAVEKGAET